MFLLCTNINPMVPGAATLDHVYTETKDPKESQETLETQDQKDCQEVLDHKDHKGLSVQVDLQALQAHVDLQEK